MKKLHKILLIFILIIISVPTVNGMKNFYDYYLNKSYYEVVTNLSEQDSRDLKINILRITESETTFDTVNKGVLLAKPDDYTKKEFVENKIYEDKYLVFITSLSKSKVDKIKQNKNVLVIKNLGESDPFRVEMH